MTVAYQAYRMPPQPFMPCDRPLGLVRDGKILCGSPGEVWVKFRKYGGPESIAVFCRDCFDHYRGLEGSQLPPFEQLPAF